LSDPTEHAAIKSKLTVAAMILDVLPDHPISSLSERMGS
jgi:hypothetical protein